MSLRLPANWGCCGWNWRRSTNEQADKITVSGGSLCGSDGGYCGRELGSRDKTAGGN